MRSVRSVLLLIAFSHLARPANNKYDNGGGDGGGDGGGVKTHINIRAPDNIARSHAGPQEYVTRHASKIVNKTTSYIAGVVSPMTKYNAEIITRRGGGTYESERITRDNSNPVLYALSTVIRLLTILVSTQYVSERKLNSLIQYGILHLSNYFVGCRFCFKIDI